MSAGTTRGEKVGIAVFLVLVIVVTHWAFFHYRGRQATTAVNVELSTSLAPLLSKHGVTSFKITSTGLRFVANGRTMCLLNAGADPIQRHRIVEIAEKEGCGQDSKVMLLDRVQMTMPRGHGLSFIYLDENEVLSADRSKDGGWLSTVELNWPRAEAGQRIAVSVAEDIEGLYAVLKLAPSEARSPAALQKYLQ
ncbi:hypothetical protein [Stenotrophomonas maltophilia]|uniref:hypothetical protein n=1 Tax=Stenotrophomonas maltophilia TaxID=40324 RepID=UPI00244A3278|nr:hypothetical protein [Stenotrophomonas maltophilia]MDH1328365.1 hypothetical protein [Stenotrophomonas maltophilia]